MKETKSKSKKQYMIIGIILLISIIVLYILNNISCNKLYISKYYDNIGIKEELLNVIYFNVGQADSTFITINGYNMLIDTGNDSDGYYIVDFLKAQNINKIDYLMLTHYDEDHIGGAYKIIDELNVNVIYAPTGSSSTEAYNNLVQSAKNRVTIDTSLKASNDVTYSLRKCHMESFKYKWE